MSIHWGQSNRFWQSVGKISNRTPRLSKESWTVLMIFNRHITHAALYTRHKSLFNQQANQSGSIEMDCYLYSEFSLVIFRTNF